MALARQQELCTAAAVGIERSFTMIQAAVQNTRRPASNSGEADRIRIREVLPGAYEFSLAMGEGNISGEFRLDRNSGADAKAKILSIAEELASACQ
jgi:hypothetical protein